jgi:hypothetical protein
VPEDGARFNPFPGAPKPNVSCPPLDNQYETCILPPEPQGNASMADKPSDLVQGTLDMLILKTLALEPMHGYGIAGRLEQMSKGVFRLNAGSLFVAIQRLQRDGLIRVNGNLARTTGTQSITC